MSSSATTCKRYTVLYITYALIKRSEILSPNLAEGSAYPFRDINHPTFLHVSETRYKLPSHKTHVRAPNKFPQKRETL